MSALQKLLTIAFTILLLWVWPVTGGSNPGPAGGMMGRDMQAMPEMIQGALVECEECRVLHPDRYRESGETCPLCMGQGERMQPARMMDEKLVAEESREELLRIEARLFEQLQLSPLEPDRIETLRQAYLRLLRFTLVHGCFSKEWLILRIHKLEKMAFERSESEQLPVDNTQE